MNPGKSVSSRTSHQEGGGLITDSDIVVKASPRAPLFSGTMWPVLRLVNATTLIKWHVLS